MHKNRMKVDAEREKCFFEQYKPKELEAIITRQHKIAEYHKKNGHKLLHSIRISLDDFADSSDVSKNSPLLNHLYVWGRHKIRRNIMTATQKFNALSPIIRVKGRQLLVFLNNRQIETMVQELSAVLIKKSNVADAENLAKANKVLSGSL